jgi:uncharacterized protein (DUF1499 family)
MSMNSRRARETGLMNGRLRPCPGTPNCVVSEYRDKESHAEPFAFSGEPGAAWENAKASIISLGGRIEKDTGDYLWATFTNRFWRFVDDVELRLDAGGKTIHVKSASRVGKGDLGVNRKRVERVRMSDVRQVCCAGFRGDLRRLGSIRWSDCARLASPSPRRNRGSMSTCPRISGSSWDCSVRNVSLRHRLLVFSQGSLIFGAHYERRVFAEPCVPDLGGGARA